MRPAYRFALATAVAGIVAGGVGLWWQLRDRPTIAADGADQIRVDPLPPSAGDPGPEKTREMLDRVEAAEAEKLGPAEAKRRRAQRERMLELRLHGDGD